MSNNIVNIKCMKDLGMVKESASQTTDSIVDHLGVVKKYVGVRIPPDILAALGKLALADDRTVSYMINKILAEYLRAMTK